MLTSTMDIVRSVFNNDSTISAHERNRLMAQLRGGAVCPVAPCEKPAERIVLRKEAAQRLGRSLRTIDALSRSGALPKIKLPGRKRGCGFRESDLLNLMEVSS